MSIRDRPQDGLESVEPGGEQRGATHNHDKDARSVWVAYKSVENLADRLIHESQAQHVQDDSHNDQR